MFIPDLLQLTVSDTWDIHVRGNYHPGTCGKLALGYAQVGDVHDILRIPLNWLGVKSKTNMENSNPYSILNFEISAELQVCVDFSTSSDRIMLHFLSTLSLAKESLRNIRLYIRR